MYGTWPNIMHVYLKNAFNKIQSDSNLLFWYATALELTLSFGHLCKFKITGRKNGAADFNQIE